MGLMSKMSKEGALFLLTIRNGRLRETSVINETQFFIVAFNC